jgi:hypothetical protein
MAVLLALALVFIFAAWKAFAATKLWVWFIVPVFGLPVISMAQMYGILLTFSLFVSHKANKSDKDVMLELTAGPLFVLIIGWIVKTFFL